MPEAMLVRSAAGWQTLTQAALKTHDKSSGERGSMGFMNRRRAAWCAVVVVVADYGEARFPANVVCGLCNRSPVASPAVAKSARAEESRMDCEESRHRWWRLEGKKKKKRKPTAHRWKRTVVWKEVKGAEMYMSR
jgi:hypothetical protein